MLQRDKFFYIVSCMNIQLMPAVSCCSDIAFEQKAEFSKILITGTDRDVFLLH